jgi:hypothetical protein
MFHIEKYCQLNQVDPHSLIPPTIHISQEDIEIIKASERVEELLSHKLQGFKEDQLYILKPGESSNRGNGISIHPSKSALLSHLSSSLTTFP